MAPNGRAMLEGSAVYRGCRTLWRWGEHSTVVQLLNDERVLFAGAFVFVAFSILRILISGLHVAVKFMSFLVFAVALVVLVWPYTKPLSDR